jgi:hypothetical protein
MISRNHTQIFHENPLKNFSSSKTFVVHKLKKNNMKIQNLKQKMNLLFNTPESYLKLPEESLFNYIIGQTPRGLGLYTESSRMISSSVIGNYTKKDEHRKSHRVNSNLSANNLSPRILHKNTRLSSSNINFSINISGNTPKKKKKSSKICRYPPLYNNVNTEINNMFNRSRRRIIKNKSQNLDNANVLFKNIPILMKPYINVPLARQEKALKNSEKYNEIMTKIENKIEKSFKMKRKTKKNLYNESNNYESCLYNSSHLMKNSGIEYRNKIEKSNSNEKKKTPHLVLNNHIQNWEMSLRRPKNFFGERREYLNVRTDSNPYWVIIREKNPPEEEKIIYRQINNQTYRGINTRNGSNNSNYKSYSKDLTNNASSANDMNNLEIKGRKLIDVEEQLKNKIKGKIKLTKFKYDRDSMKNIIFKKNYFINKHIIKNK